MLLADARCDGDLFYRHVVNDVHGEQPRIGVGGRCDHLGGFARSYREVQQALKLQMPVGGREQVTAFDDLVLGELAARNLLLAPFFGPSVLQLRN